MKIIVDADACPVKNEIEWVAKKYGAALYYVTDTTHHITSAYGKVFTVDKQRDSADFFIVNQASQGDIIITQDYGLGAMALAKGAYALNNNGYPYTKENIDRLLLDRHLNKKAREQGLRTKNPKKRNKNDNEQFKNQLEQFIKTIIL